MTPPPSQENRLSDPLGPEDKATAKHFQGLENVPVRCTSSAKSCRVLVIEDNHDSARTLRVLLTRYGHEVEVAHSGTRGVEKAREWHPDVVLCDLGLPEMNGYDVARTLRRDPELAATRLIAVSGYGQDEDRRLSAEAGFELHLTKPVQPAELRRLLTAASA